MSRATSDKFNCSTGCNRLDDRNTQGGDYTSHFQRKLFGELFSKAHIKFSVLKQMYIFYPLQERACISVMTMSTIDRAVNTIFYIKKC